MSYTYNVSTKTDPVVLRNFNTTKIKINELKTSINSLPPSQNKEKCLNLLHEIFIHVFYDVNT